MIKLMAVEVEEDCEFEWAMAKLICEDLLANRDPPKGVTGGCTSVYDCARGLVPERCGGNAVVY